MAHQSGAFSVWRIHKRIEWLVAVKIWPECIVGWCNVVEDDAIGSTGDDWCFGISRMLLRLRDESRALRDSARVMYSRVSCFEYYVEAWWRTWEVLIEIGGLDLWDGWENRRSSLAICFVKFGCEGEPSSAYARCARWRFMVEWVDDEEGLNNDFCSLIISGARSSCS